MPFMKIAADILYRVLTLNKTPAHVKNVCHA